MASSAVVDGYEMMLMNSHAPIHRSVTLSEEVPEMETIAIGSDRSASGDEVPEEVWEQEEDDEGDDGAAADDFSDDLSKSSGELSIHRPSRQVPAPMPSSVPVRNAHDILKQKRELLYQIGRLEAKGLVAPKRFGLNDPLDEIQAEYERLKLDRETDISVRFQRKMLMTCVTGIELLNKTFDPFNIHLTGWSDSLHDSIGDYDEVFEDLHMKYRSRGIAMAPELKLLFMVGGSGVMFHLTSTMFRKANVPGLEQVMRQNPGLMRDFAQATMNAMNSPQSPQQQPQQYQYSPPPPPQQQSRPNPLGGLGSLFGSLFGGGGGGAESSGPPPPYQPMRGPTPVSDILKDMHRGAFQDQSHNLEVDEADAILNEFSNNADSNQPPPPSSSNTPPPTIAKTAGRKRAPRGGSNVMNIS